MRLARPGLFLFIKYPIWIALPRTEYLGFPWQHISEAILQSDWRVSTDTGVQEAAAEFIQAITFSFPRLMHMNTELANWIDRDPISMNMYNVPAQESSI